MKKVLMLLLVCVMALNLCACGGEKPVDSGSGKDTTPTDVINTDEKGGSDSDKESHQIEDGSKSPVKESDTPTEPTASTQGDTGPTGMSIETGSVHGAKLMDAPPRVDAGSYVFSDPVSVDEELGFATYEMPVRLSESPLTKQYGSIGEFESQEEFLKAWTPYAEGMFDAIHNDGVLPEVALYGEEDNGDHIFGNDVNNQHSYSLDCDPNGYQSVNYTFNMFVDVANESWDSYDYSELVQLIQYYTGIELTTGDLYNLQSMIAEKLDAGAEKWYIDVQSNEPDCYDSFSVAGYNFTEGVQSWHFTAERMISKWADLYDREALRNGNIVGSNEG